MACYLYDVLGRKSADMQIEQGWLMPPPSPSVIRVRLDAPDGRIRGLMVGGRARSTSVVQVEV